MADGCRKKERKVGEGNNKSKRKIIYNIEELFFPQVKNTFTMEQKKDVRRSEKRYNEVEEAAAAIIVLEFQLI